jgi:antitoxin YefM
MTTLTATEARANLYRVIDETAELHVPVRITKKKLCSSIV